MTVIPLLKQSRRAQLELAEPTFAILAARHERTVVETLVILDPHHQPSVESLALDLDRLRVLQYQRLDRAEVLIVP